MRSEDPSRPFGEVLTAMVTPFDADGKVDLQAAAALATYLVDEQANDGLVISGTAGEAPTTTDQEKFELLQTVVAAVGDRAHVVAGVGTFDTAHSVQLAQQAAEAGADGLLVVTPYYSKPQQAGVVAHFQAVADATSLPHLVYDVPHRSAIEIREETLIELSADPRLVGVKDAKGNIASSARVMAAAAAAGHQFAYYCGDDALTLALLAVGGVGVVGTSTAFAGAATKEMISAFVRGDHGSALALHRQLEPIFTGIFAAPGCVLVKAGLAQQGRLDNRVRLPLVPATEAELAALLQCLEVSGLR